MEQKIKTMTKEEKILLKMLFKFLKQYNAYDEYKINTINAALTNWKYNDDKQIANALMLFKKIKTNNSNDAYKTFYRIIKYSFIWSETSQGFSYWFELNLKWEKRLFLTIPNIIDYIV